MPNLDLQLNVAENSLWKVGWKIDREEPHWKYVPNQSIGLYRELSISEKPPVFWRLFLLVFNLIGTRFSKLQKQKFAYSIIKFGSMLRRSTSG